MDENTIEINWEDAPEGTTHYHTWIGKSPWVKKTDEGLITFYWHECIGWVYWKYCHNNEKYFIERPSKVCTSNGTTTEDSYTNPKADPFTVSLKQRLTSQPNLEEYLKSIYDKVDQGDEDVDVFVIDMTASLEKQGEDMLNFLTSKKEAEKYSTLFGLEEVEDILQKKDLNVSWYDYDKEELIGLPEKGEIVYDRHTQEDVEYLGKLHYEDTVILEDGIGRCYDRCITHLKPLNYRDSPKHQTRKEQHKLFETLVGDVDRNLQGYTHKAGAIELYNKGWRVSKEDV